MFQSLDKVVLGRIMKNELIWSALKMWQCRVVEWQLNKSYRWYHSILISTWHTWTISMKHNMTCKKQPCSAKTGRFWPFFSPKTCQVRISWVSASLHATGFLSLRNNHRLVARWQKILFASFRRRDLTFCPLLFLHWALSVQGHEKLVCASWMFSKE